MDARPAIPGLDDAGLVQTISHVNLHYRSNDDARAAARLLEVLGLVRAEEMPLPNGSTFFRFTTDREHLDSGAGIVYAGRVPAQLAAVQAAARAALGVDTPQEHETVRALRAALLKDPEYNFHVGFLYNSLEQIEARMAELQRLEREDPAFRGRMKFLVNRATPGNAAFDARLDASPLYKGVTRYTYGHNGVQAFVETDLFTGGPLGWGLVFELDYVLPGVDDHILARSTNARLAPATA